MPTSTILQPRRRENESYEDYRERRSKANQKIKEYLNKPVGQGMKPSTRILRRIVQGKRNVHALSSAERRHIQRVIGFAKHKETDRQWENRLLFFLHDVTERTDIGSQKFFNEIKEINEEHRKLS
jgi:hypothetical protein